MEELVMSEVKQNVKVFEILEELVDDLTKKVSSKVKLHNVKNLFSYFATILTLVLFVHCCSHIVNDFLYERRQPIRLSLSSLFISVFVRKSRR